MKNLNNCMTEMSVDEMREVNGGSWITVLVKIAKILIAILS